MRMRGDGDTASWSAGREVAAWPGWGWAVFHGLGCDPCGVDHCFDRLPPGCAARPGANDCHAFGILNRNIPKSPGFAARPGANGCHACGILNRNIPKGYQPLAGGRAERTPPDFQRPHDSLGFRAISAAGEDHHVKQSGQHGSMMRFYSFRASSAGPNFDGRIFQR